MDEGGTNNYKKREKGIALDKDMMNKTYDIIIPPEIIQEIANSEADFCKRVRKCDPIEAAKNLTKGYKDILISLENLVGKDKLWESKILEIGSGNGFFLCYALRCGLNIVGVEPGKNYGFKGRYSRNITLLKANGIQNPQNFLFDALAEALPFADNSFDVVFSVAVLEHVQNLNKAMEESIRVLRPGGILWANIPNYNSIYEGHYNIFWIPYMNKTIAKLYVSRIFKRDPYFIDELNFTTPSMFKKYLNSKLCEGKLHLGGKGLSASVLNIYNMSTDKNRLPNPERYKGLKKIIASLFNFTPFLFCLKVPTFIVAKFLQLIGFAIVFDVILHKKETNESQHCPVSSLHIGSV